MKKCDWCDHDPSQHCATHKRDLHKCDACGVVLCDTCLRKAAAEQGVTLDLLHCEDCGDLCPKCFVDEQR